MSGDDVLIAFIREAIRTGRYFFTDHALNKHPFEEGFTPADALTAIENGQIIEHYERESRCLIAGSVPGLKQSREFNTNYIHCVCQYDRVSARSSSSRCIVLEVANG